MSRSNQTPWNHDYSLLLQVADDSNRLGMILGIAPVKLHGEPTWLGPNIAAINAVLAALKRIHANELLDSMKSVPVERLGWLAADPESDDNDSDREPPPDGVPFTGSAGTPVGPENALVGVTQEWIGNRIERLTAESDWFSALHFAPWSYVELAAAIFEADVFNRMTRKACQSYDIRDDDIHDIYTDAVCMAIGTTLRRALIWYLNRNRSEDNWFGRVSATIGNSEKGWLKRAIKKHNKYRRAEPSGWNDAAECAIASNDYSPQEDQHAEISDTIKSVLTPEEQRRFEKCLEQHRQVSNAIWNKMKQAASQLVDD
ncbi:MAG: hypothetical protein KDB14_02270 [Planctomycetales bacterium]|nr:hypothetical protein [Planctomycetales bacterium]